MQNKICVVTGANTGIGKATALGLAKLGATVVMVCRNRKRGAAALAEIKQQSGNQAVVLLLADLSSQAAIRQLAAEFTAQYPALHVLVNNAAIFLQQRTVTADGLEMQFAVNHLACFLLTNLLLDTLKAGAPARIVNVSSQTHSRGTIDFDDLQSERDYRATIVYADVKLANILFTYELARRLQGSGVTANCLHPGVVATNLLADYRGMPRAPRSASGSMGSGPKEGARTSLYLAAAPEVAGVSGEYFADSALSSSSRASHDAPVARRLWDVSARLCGLPVSG